MDSIKVSAMGRSGQVGDFYDQVTGNVLPSEYIDDVQ